MRMLLKVSIPVEKGTEAYKSGVLQRTFQATAAALKPEAMYFFRVGLRGGADNF
jgi:hypothetical protein